MSRRNLMLGLVLVLMILLVGALAYWSLSAPLANRLLVAGNVRAVARTVSAPAISYPNPDYSVSVPSNASSDEHIATIEHATPRQTGSQAVSRNQPAISGRLAHVYVKVGDRVRAGQVIARLDTALLELGIRQAKINATKARAAVRVVKNNLDEVIDKQEEIDEGWDEVASGRRQITSGKTSITSGRSELKSAKSGLLATQEELLEAKRNRSKLEAQLAALKQQAATYPPGHVPASLQKQIAELEGLLASIDPGLAEVSAGLKEVDSGLAQLATAYSALVSAQYRLNNAADELVSAEDALRKAKNQLIRARSSLSIIADAQPILISLASAARNQATITAPVSGVVTQAAPQGTIAMVGAPVARIVPDEPELVDTYLTGEQLAHVHKGTVADITCDSAPGKSMSATLCLIEDQALFPPTAFPTNIVHMTNTVKVTFQLSPGVTPPLGTPVDVAIHMD